MPMGMPSASAMKADTKDNSSVAGRRSSSSSLTGRRWRYEAEIAARGGHEARVLHHEGIVQAQLLAQLFTLFRRGVLAHHGGQGSPT